MAEPTMLEQLLGAMEDAKAIIRQAHEATTDLRQATREAREVFKQLERDEWEPRIKTDVERQVAELGETFAETATRASEKVMQRFEKLSNLLLHGNEQGRGESLEPQIRKVAAERHPQGNGR